MEQAQDTFCKTATLQVGCQRSALHLDHYGFLIRKSIVDKATLVGVLELLRKRMLYLSPHPLIAGHPGQRRVYDTLRQNYY